VGYAWPKPSPSDIHKDMYVLWNPGSAQLLFSSCDVPAPAKGPVCMWRVSTWARVQGELLPCTRIPPPDTRAGETVGTGKTINRVKQGIAVQQSKWEYSAWRGAPGLGSPNFSLNIPSREGIDFRLRSSRPSFAYEGPAVVAMSVYRRGTAPVIGQRP